MAEYSFLLGSGVSLESGVQSVSQITNAIFEYEYCIYPDQSIVRGEYPSEYLRELYNLTYVQDFLKLLKEKNDKYLNDRFGDQYESNFEDLYDLAQQIHQEAGIFRDNVAIRPFYDTIEDETSELRDRYPGHDEPIGMQTLSKKALDLIETVVKYGLNPEALNGLDLISELVKANNSLEIFTLNHDLLIEDLCSENNFSISDGFSEVDGQVRWYTPEIWEEDVDVKIYKLHGSRNWVLVRHRKKGQALAILTGRDKWHNKDKNGTLIDLLLDTGWMLTGQRKSEKYYSGIHGEVHYRFSNHLRSCNNLIVSGYGWNDIQMNWKLFDWLDSHDENKMIIIHEKPKEMAENSRQLNYRSFSGYEQRGKIEFIEKWFQNVGLEDVVGFTNDKKVDKVSEDE